MGTGQLTKNETSHFQEGQARNMWLNHSSSNRKLPTRQYSMLCKELCTPNKCVQFALEGTYGKGLRKPFSVHLAQTAFL